MRIPDSLNEIAGKACAISLHSRKIGKRVVRNWRDKAQTGRTERTEVIDSAVVHSKCCRGRNVIEVHAKLRVVSAHGPGEIVDHLIALLGALNVGVRLAAEIGKTRNVYRRVRAAWDGRVIEVRQTPARVLDPELVHLVIADGPGVLQHAGNVAVGLFGSTGIRVQPYGLVLAADLDAGDRAGARIDPQHQAIVGVDIVIDTQGIETRPLKYREVPRL